MKRPITINRRGALLLLMERDKRCGGKHAGKIADEFMDWLGAENFPGGVPCKLAHERADEFIEIIRPVIEAD